MFFTKLKLTTQEIEAIIYAINLEYQYTTDEQLSKLISKNFDLPLAAVIDTLKAYRGLKDEDFEQQSNMVAMNMWY